MSLRVKISPSFHWVKSLYTHYIEFCHNGLICSSAVALLGLSREPAAGVCLLCGITRGEEEAALWLPRFLLKHPEPNPEQAEDNIGHFVDFDSP